MKATLPLLILAFSAPASACPNLYGSKSCTFTSTLQGESGQYSLELTDKGHFPDGVPRIGFVLTNVWGQKVEQDTFKPDGTLNHASGGAPGFQLTYQESCTTDAIIQEKHALSSEGGQPVDAVTRISLNATAIGVFFERTFRRTVGSQLTESQSLQGDCQ